MNARRCILKFGCVIWSMLHAVQHYATVNVATCYNDHQLSDTDAMRFFLVCI